MCIGVTCEVKSSIRYQCVRAVWETHAADFLFFAYLIMSPWTPVMSKMYMSREANISKLVASQALPRLTKVPRANFFVI